MSDERLPQSEIILYQTEDGRTRIQCRFQDETVWLTQKLMADLFQIGVGTVNHHLKAVFADGELEPAATIRRYRIVQNEGSREIAREVEHYNLEAVLAVGFRVRSHRGTQFRQWATARLSETSTATATTSPRPPRAGDLRRHLPRRTPPDPQREGDLRRDVKSATVSPRDVFRFALSDHAASVILFHNHPSGDPSPSPQDLAFTTKLLGIGEALGVEVLDHLIVTTSSFLSFKQRALL